MCSKNKYILPKHKKNFKKSLNQKGGNNKMKLDKNKIQKEIKTEGKIC